MTYYRAIIVLCTLLAFYAFTSCKKEYPPKPVVYVFNEPENGFEIYSADSSYLLCTSSTLESIALSLKDIKNYNYDKIEWYKNGSFLSTTYPSDPYLIVKSAGTYLAKISYDGKTYTSNSFIVGTRDCSGNVFTLFGTDSYIMSNLHAVRNLDDNSFTLTFYLRETPEYVTATVTLRLNKNQMGTYSFYQQPSINKLDLHYYNVGDYKSKTTDPNSTIKINSISYTKGGTIKGSFSIPIYSNNTGAFETTAAGTFNFYFVN